MKRGWLILIGGLVLAMLAYGGSYFAGMARSNRIIANQTPELAWLQNEFHLSDSEFTRICQLHESYAEGCAERCRRIDAKNAELQNLLAKTNAVTPEIKDPDGFLRRGAHAVTHVERKNFGLIWNAVLESGGFVVGDDVEVAIDVEFMRQPE